MYLLRPGHYHNCCHLFSVGYVPGAMLHDSFLAVTLQSRSYCSHFTMRKQTQRQSGLPKCIQIGGGRAGFQSRPSCCQSPLPCHQATLSNKHYIVYFSHQPSRVAFNSVCKWRTCGFRSPLYGQQSRDTPVWVTPRTTLQESGAV